MHKTSRILNVMCSMLAFILRAWADPVCGERSVGYYFVDSQQDDLRADHISYRQRVCQGQAQGLVERFTSQYTSLCYLHFLLPSQSATLRLLLLGFYHFVLLSLLLLLILNKLLLLPPPPLLTPKYVYITATTTTTTTTTTATTTTTTNF